MSAPAETPSPPNAVILNVTAPSSCLRSPRGARRGPHEAALGARRAPRSAEAILSFSREREARERLIGMYPTNPRFMMM